MLPVDHPFWKIHRPPNGWRCCCRVMSLSQAEYDRGYSIERQGGERDAGAQGVYKRFNTKEPVVPLREYVNPRTGEVIYVPEGIDPGFAYNPGQARQQAMRQQIQNKSAAAVPALGRRLSTLDSIRGRDVGPRYSQPPSDPRVFQRL